MRGTAHESKENYRRYSTRWESASRKLAMPGETPRVANPTWRGQKGWDRPLDNNLSLRLNTGHRVGAAMFIFGLGG